MHYPPWTTLVADVKINTPAWVYTIYVTRSEKRRYLLFAHLLICPISEQTNPVNCLYIGGWQQRGYSRSPSWRGRSVRCWSANVNISLLVAVENECLFKISCWFGGGILCFVYNWDDYSRLHILKNIYLDYDLYPIGNMGKWVIWFLLGLRNWLILIGILLHIEWLPCCLRFGGVIAQLCYISIPDLDMS